MDNIIEKKKVLFVIPSMEIGGTRSSLVNLLHNIYKDEKISISLFVVNHEGVLFNQLPDEVCVLPQVKALAWAIPSNRPHSMARRLYHYTIAILNRFIGYKKVYKILFSIYSGASNLRCKYDVVIGYQEGVSTYIASLFNSEKLICYVHSDIDKWYNKRDFEYKAYKKAASIIFVADNTRRLFCKYVPGVSEKCEVIKNTINKEDIIARSNIDAKKIFTPDDVFKIVSIGRFTEAKRFDRIVEAACYLKDNGIKFIWQILGDGELFNEIKDQIVNKDLSQEIILQGAKSNPYPYIKKSDLVVVCSQNESQPMVILEALTLSRPVLTTGYKSALEILEDGKYGSICDNDSASLCVSLKKIIENKNLYDTLVKKAEDFDYDNYSIVNKTVNMLCY